MGKQAKKRTLNVTPYSIERISSWSGSGFTLAFFDDKYKVCLHLDIFDIEYLAGRLHEQIRHLEKLTADAKGVLQRGE